MVKMIVLDVDGVIVGNQHGVNFPYPHQKVIDALEKVRKSGIPVVLCSGKYYSAIEPVIRRAHLNNPHITDSGGLIINPLSQKEIIAFNIEKKVVSEILRASISDNIHAEAFSRENYFIQKDQLDNLTRKRFPILQKDPIVVNFLPEIANEKQIFKIIVKAKDSNEKTKAENTFRPFAKQISFVWTTHPTTGSLNYGVITSKNTSKILALMKVSQSLGIPLTDTLGVGDTLGDWEFMKKCGYAATMAEAPDELKELVQFTAPSVNDNGILQILKHFLK